MSGVRRRTFEERLVRRATRASLIVAGGLIALKLWAWLFTGSVALLGSLADSCLDFVASLGAFYSVRVAQAGASEEYRFGRAKAEAIAAFTQALLVTGSGLFIVYESLRRLFTEEVVVHSGFGIAVAAISLAATFGLVSYQRWVLSRTESLAVKADSLHYVSDLLGSVAVLVALVAVSRGFGWADPVAGLMIAFWLVWSAREIALEALDILLDRELSAAEREEIRGIVLSHDEVLRIMGLRSRRAGSKKFVEIRLGLEGGMRLYRVQAISAAIVADLQTRFPEADIVVHPLAGDGGERSA